MPKSGANLFLIPSSSMKRMSPIPGEHDDEETDYVRQMVNYYTDYDLSGDVLKNQYIPSGGIIRSSKNSNENYVWRNQLSYNETFGKHDVTALAGMEISEYKENIRHYLSLCSGLQ